jgi:hypothetical protein
MSNKNWLDKLSEDERLNLRNEIENKIAAGLAVANTDYLLQLIDEHRDNDKVRTAWNDNFDQWYEIIKKYAKPKNDEYVPCQDLSYGRFWGGNANASVIDLNAIEKHWQGQNSFSFKNFKFIFPVKLTGKTKFHIFAGAKFSADADFAGATFSFVVLFSNATFLSRAYFNKATFESGADFDGATFEFTAYFKDATFSSSAYFAGAKFSSSAGFAGATFSSVAYFNSATFSSVANFSGATFTSAIYFQNSEFLNYPPNFTGIKELKYLPVFDSGPEALAQQLPTQTCRSEPTGNEECYRKLKIIAKQHENSELEGFFYRRELLCKYHRLEQQGTDQLIRCGINAYEWLFSCGWSIIKPISLWLMLTMIFTVLYYLALHVMPSGITSVAIIMMVVFLARQIICSIRSILLPYEIKELRKCVALIRYQWIRLVSKCQPLPKCKFIRWLGVVSRLRNWQYIKLLLLSVVMLILAVMLPDETSFSFKQALPIVSGLDSLGRTYDEIFPQRRMLHPQCGRLEDDGKKSDEEREKEINEAIAKILPQCKIPTALMILAIIHKISSGILIFMFLLALRNNFKMS